MKVGLNLFSIKNRIQTEEDFLQTALTIKDYGYSYMQFSGADMKASQIANVVEKSGLPVYLTHSPYERIVDDLDNLMEEHSSFGCKYIGLGSLPVEGRNNQEECKRIVEKLNRSAIKMGENGFKLFYHHHHFEFYKLFGEKTIFDYMIENAPELNFTVDTYWLQYGGVDVINFIKRLKGRIACVHLKDYMQVPDEKGWATPTFAPVGSGVMDFKSIIPVMKEMGTEYYFVEQDNASKLDDGMEQIKKSVEYLKEI